ncbi:hypothetical protein [Solimonas sp. K1W22B-7]|uniref:hypothetical protein n=1 Tax=Solimonas sp. K1W22B-7 TaxID=2303331 RepID=UPI0019697FAB|nr:hypothetical protein [Solimonas sp. K1W22B-7]
MNSRTLTMRALLLASALSLGFGVVACKKEEPTPMEKAEENVKDAFDARPNEALKDAGEDAKSAVQNAGDAVEQKADEVKQDAQH